MYSLALTLRFKTSLYYDVIRVAIHGPSENTADKKGKSVSTKGL